MSYWQPPIPTHILEKAQQEYGFELSNEISWKTLNTYLNSIGFQIVFDPDTSYAIVAL